MLIPFDLFCKNFREKFCYTIKLTFVKVIMTNIQQFCNKNYFENRKIQYSQLSPIGR